MRAVRYDEVLHANFRRSELEYRLKKVAETREAWERAGCPDDWRWLALKKAVEAWVEKEAEGEK